MLTSFAEARGLGTPREVAVELGLLRLRDNRFLAASLPRISHVSCRNL